MDLAAVAFGARCAVLLSRGDESGVASLTREFVALTTGTVEPEVVEELLRLASSLLAAFGPGVLQGILSGLEQGLAGQLDDGGEAAPT